MTKVIKEYPPNFEQIDKIFNVRGKHVIYSWGDVIYSPHPDTFITPELYAHEAVHGKRQTPDTKSIEAWWERYLIDVEFRLSEELLAHRAEYREFCRTNLDRNDRNRFLTAVANRLSGPLYLNGISLSKARQSILKG